MKKLILFSFFLLFFFSPISIANLSINVSSKNLEKISLKYGPKGLKRVQLWDKMLEKSKDEKILQKLKNVNDFFNKISYKTDISHWKKKDYWATPFEFLGSGAGDCEDYAIGKYFSLRYLGIPDEKLRIMYVTYKVKRSKFDRTHMVLTYTHKKGSTPIVLDNINKKLKLANKRKDLIPVYSFNASGLWQAKKKGSVRVGNNNLKSWKKLISRI